MPRWKPFDPSRNFPDLGARFKTGEQRARAILRNEKMQALAAARRTGTNTGRAAPVASAIDDEDEDEEEDINDKTDLDWSTVIKRTFEAYIRGERPNMYGEWIEWNMA